MGEWNQAKISDDTNAMEMPIRNMVSIIVDDIEKVSELESQTGNILWDYRKAT